MGLVQKNSTNQTTDGKTGIFLEKEECELILSLISNSTFQGKDVGVVYDTVYKIQTHYEGLMTNTTDTR